MTKALMSKAKGGRSRCPTARSIPVNIDEDKAIQRWRGIYFTFDVRRRAGYVGSASGAANILGRWMDYAARGHGGNKMLRDSLPSELRFSILQRVSPDTDAVDVVHLEATWKARLHTISAGLNLN